MNRIFASTALALFLLASATLFASSGQTSRSLVLPDVHFLQSTSDKPSTKGSFSLALPDVYFLQSTTDKPSTKGSFSLALPDVHFLQSTTDKPSTKSSFSLFIFSVGFPQNVAALSAEKSNTVGSYAKEHILLPVFCEDKFVEQRYLVRTERRNSTLLTRC